MTDPSTFVIRPSGGRPSCVRHPETGVIVPAIDLPGDALVCLSCARGTPADETEQDRRRREEREARAAAQTETAQDLADIGLQRQLRAEQAMRDRRDRRHRR